MDIRGATSRHEARQVALQVLYAVELTGDDPIALYGSLVKGGDPRHRTFAQNLVQLACRHKKQMDGLISGKSERWDLDRMALLDHLILRLSLCELFYVEDVPPKVTINEAIEIAKLFSTDQSGRFINGILDALFEENEQVIRKVKKESPANGEKRRNSSGPARGKAKKDGSGPDSTDS